MLAWKRSFALAAGVGLGLFAIAYLVYRHYYIAKFDEGEGYRFRLKWPTGFSGAIPIVDGGLSPQKIDGYYELDARPMRLVVPIGTISGRAIREVEVLEDGKKIPDGWFDDAYPHRAFRGFELLGAPNQRWAFVGTKSEFDTFYSEAVPGAHKGQVWVAPSSRGRTSRTVTRER
jgi:hypothetical protein